MTEILQESCLPALLDRFYARVRADDLLGPVFATVEDWPAHMARLRDFWSSVMLTTGRYKGNPMAMHVALADRIDPAMFTRWLALWAAETEAQLPPAIAAAMQAKANRIAESLQMALAMKAGHGGPPRFGNGPQGYGGPTTPSVRGRPGPSQAANGSLG